MEEDNVREQDRLLPIANVVRIMKQILPPNAKISKPAKETLQESASEFIAFVTGEATDKCRRERRKTVNGDDVCWALSSLGFDNYALALRRYLQRYRDLEGDRLSSALQVEADGSEDLREREEWTHHQQRPAPATGVAGGVTRVRSGDGFYWGL